MNKIKEYRNIQKLTVRELSDKANVATGYISMLENDSKGKMNPSKDVMVKIANALGKTVPKVFFSNE